MSTFGNCENGVLFIIAKFFLAVHASQPYVSIIMYIILALQVCTLLEKIF